MSFKPEQLLRRAIEAGRGALRDLEADQVPASMRRIAAHTGGTLPPPFARALLHELDCNEFLRGKALESFGDDDGSPSHRFLERGEGWALEVAVAAHDLGSRTAVTSDRTLEIERDALAAQIVSLKERYKAAIVVRDKAERKAREAVQAQRAPLRSERAAEERWGVRLAEVEEAHAVVVAAVQAERDRLGDEVGRQRVASRAERKQRAELEARLNDRNGWDISATDPDGLAGHLDLVAQLATAATPSRGVGEGQGNEASVAPLDFSGTVRPDTAESIDWVSSVGQLTAFVDGYNLGFLLLGEIDPPKARSLTLEVLGRLARACPDADLYVVFDSRSDGRDGLASQPGVYSVIFAGSADDEIVARCHTTPRSVVITNDRELRHRAEVEGAVTLWSDALAAWSRRR